MKDLSNYRVIFSKSNVLSSSRRFINVNSLKSGTKILVIGSIKKGEMLLTINFGNTIIKEIDFKEKEYEFTLDKAGSYRFTLNQAAHTGTIFIYKEK